MNIIEVLEQEQLRSDIPEFKAGDTVKVYCKIVEAPAFVKTSPFVVFLTALA